MLEEMQLFCLMLLLAGHGLLIRGCTAINASIPTSTDTISTHFDGVSTILDELADILAELTPPPQAQGLAKAGQGGSIPEMLITSFMGQFLAKNSHGPKETEWQIRQDNPPPTLETENELD